MENKRLLSLDILRGLTIILMIIVNDPGAWNHVYAPLLHAPWNGITPTDYVFPTFLFIVGVSIVLSMNKQKESGKSLSEITLAQKKATENVFKKKKIPFRSFEIKKRDEKTLGELFCFFILETILIGQSMNLNPYDQPAVELIKVETKKLLIKNS